MADDEFCVVGPHRAEHIVIESGRAIGEASDRVADGRLVHEPLEKSLIVGHRNSFLCSDRYVARLWARIRFHNPQSPDGRFAGYASLSSSVWYLGASDFTFSMNTACSFSP